MSASETTFVGNLTSDPELTFTTGGAAKLAFSIAVNYYWNDQAGEKQEKTSFFNIIAWRQTAEDAAAILEQRSYDDKEGKSRSVIELVADEIAVSVRSLESVEWKARASADAGATNTRRAAPQQAKRAVSNDEPF